MSDMAEASWAASGGDGQVMKQGEVWCVREGTRVIGKREKEKSQWIVLEGEDKMLTTLMRKWRVDCVKSVSRTVDWIGCLSAKRLHAREVARLV